MIASQLYALSQGKTCQGREFCHWCGGPCDCSFIHDDLPSMPFVKPKNLPKRPSELYACIGCHLWRRPRVTVRRFDRTQQDSQSPLNHSWFVTSEDARTIRESDYGQLYQILLKPPKTFLLALIHSESKTVNHLHLAFANNLHVVEAGSRLQFTINNIAMTYSPYELEHGLRNGGKGKEPGVQALINLLGPFSLPPLEVPIQNSRGGRPIALEDGKVLKKPV